LNAYMIHNLINNLTDGKCRALSDPADRER